VLVASVYALPDNMNRLIYGALAITGLTSCAPAAGSTPAQTPESAPPPLAVAALKPPLDSLAFYAGTWQCKGTSHATKDQPEEKWEARMEVEPELSETSYSHVETTETDGVVTKVWEKLCTKM
jgi:hypothetical protein